MKINILKAPIKARFTEGQAYHLYGRNVGENQAFVFDDNAEAFFLHELEWEIAF